MPMLSINGDYDPIAWWNRLSRFPGGSLVYSKALGYMVPYTGTIDAHVQKLGEGASQVQMRNTRKIRNHMGTVHAIATSNLVELAATLALLSRSEKIDCIVTEISTKFYKAARGKFVWAICNTAELDLRKSTVGEVDIFCDNVKVAKGKCTWRIWK